MRPDPSASEESSPETLTHRPVLIREVLEALHCRPASRKIYLDCTVGGGGHLEAILAATAPDGKAVGFDRDEETLRAAEERLAPYRERLILRKASFLEIAKVAQELNLKEIDGILFDLGISSVQLDDPERGFSFQRPGPLDMRMDRRQQETAADWVNRLSQSELTEILRQYGEERWSKRIASAIVRFRESQGEITRAEELESIVWRAVPPATRHRRIHPATRTFQALRIVVNGEMEQLEAGLESAVSLLARGGRLAMISFHSLEDRLVKRAFKRWTQIEAPRRFMNLYKKPITPGPEEIAQNRRARSAKLRVLERVA